MTHIYIMEGHRQFAESRHSGRHRKPGFANRRGQTVDVWHVAGYVPQEHESHVSRSRSKRFEPTRASVFRLVAPRAREFATETATKPDERGGLV